MKYQDSDELAEAFGAIASIVFFVFVGILYWKFMW